MDEGLPQSVVIAYAVSIGYWVGVAGTFLAYFLIVLCCRRRKAAQPFPV
jgi:hypothetical protein